MDTSQLIRFLTQSQNLPIANDPLFDSVLLYLRLDKETNTFGLPFWKDYSKYSYQVRIVNGSSSSSGFGIVDNTELPVFPNQGEDDVQSYGRLDNSFNHLLRLNELNSLLTLTSSSDLRSAVNPLYIETLLNGQVPINLESSDFTIELAFFVDELTVPWRYQSLIQQGNCLQVQYLGSNNTLFSNILTPNSNSSGNWGIFINQSRLVFIANGVEYPIYTTLLARKTWYRVCVIRSGNTLKTYINNEQVSSLSFTANLTVTIPTNLQTEALRVSLGASRVIRERDFPNNPILEHAIDTSFSGGYSHVRITKAVRYLQNRYTASFPFPIYSIANKIDASFQNTLWNIPLTYDLYDYSKNLAHFSNLQQLKEVLDPNQGYLTIDGTAEYVTRGIVDVLDSNQFTLEGYLGYLIDQVHYRRNIDSPEVFNLYSLIFIVFDYDRLNLEVNFAVPLLRVHSLDKLGIEVGIRFFVKRRSFSASRDKGYYFYVKLSSDGETWRTYEDEEGLAMPSSGLTFPSNEIKFFAGHDVATITPSEALDNFRTIPHQDSASEPKLHFAIQKYQNNLYIIVNGIVRKTIAANFAIHQSGNLYLTAGSLFSSLLVAETDVFTSEVVRAREFSFGLQGLRLSNLARYSVVNTATTPNNYVFNHSLHPLALATGKLNPPRVRIIDILRRSNLIIVSSEFVEWVVYLNMPVDNLLLADFTLIQLNGLSDCTLISLTALSEYEYVVRASTGTGGGTLTLLFNDRKTVVYKDSTTTISNAIGELSFEGEFYNINKANPEVILSSGDNPYVKGRFTVVLTFIGAISEVDFSKLGLSNCALVETVLTDDINYVYTLTIEPLKEGIVIVQALDGVGITNSGIKSNISNKLVRIFSDFFEILHTPLSITSTLFDYSPSRLTLEEVVPNSLTHNAIAPFGEASSLDVNPLLEQSGLIYRNYNAVGSQLINAINLDWTIEFFIRVNTSGNKTAHIVSVEKAGSGFCIVAQNGFIRVQRSMSEQTNFFPSISLREIPTTSYVTWENTGFSTLQKYPHVAITKKGNTYRFYMNGVRVGIVQATTAIDITQGDLRIGYYENRVNDQPYLVSNIRMTLGKALYTTFNYNVPQLPYTIPVNITDTVELLNYVSIYSSNPRSDRAIENDTITLKFSSIINLTNSPVVTILGRTVTATRDDNNIYVATTTVGSSDVDGVVDFEITIANEPNLPTKTFSTSTNASSVVIDKTPLSITITTIEPNNNAAIIPITILLSEPSKEFNLSHFTVSNAVISNLLQLSDIEYTATLRGLTTGNMSVRILANTIRDVANNYNIASNTLTRAVTIPAYIPDPHFSNVLLLLDNDSQVVDSSNFEHSITNNNVTLSNLTSPVGSTSSLYFNGINSSLRVNIGQTLTKTVDYTIELFLYASTSTLFRLGRPTLYPASNISNSEFTLQWSEVDEATNYVLDVARTASFDSYVSGYKHLNTGNVTELTIENDGNVLIPSLRPLTYLSDKGFILDWNKTSESIAYSVDLALDANFQQKLYQYDNKTTLDSFYGFGDISNLTTLSAELQSQYVTTDLTELDTGVLLTGILGNSTSYPKLYYVLQESTVRLYDKENYSEMLIAEDIDPLEWQHIALVNKGKFTYLYVNGILQDKIRNVEFDTSFDIGYALGNFKGHMQGIRITKGVARYTDSFNPPTLPYPRN